MGKLVADKLVADKLAADTPVVGGLGAALRAAALWGVGNNLVGKAAPCLGHNLGILGPELEPRLAH